MRGLSRKFEFIGTGTEASIARGALGGRDVGSKAGTLGFMAPPLTEREDIAEDEDRSSIFGFGSTVGRGERDETI